MLKTSLYRLFLISLMQFSVIGSAFAFENKFTRSSNILIKQAGHAVHLGRVQYSQNGRAKLRSRSDVIAQVKKRYKAEVLKVTLDERKQVYRVRILMPNGKVRNLTISASR